MANNAAHNTATTVIGDRATPDVSLNVAAVAVSGLSGGTSALSWSAPDGLADGQTLIVETDGAYDFGSGPQYYYYPALEDYAGGELMQDSPYYEVTAASNVLNQGYGLINGRSVAAEGVTGASSLRGQFRIPDVNGLNGAFEFQEVFFKYTVRVANDTEIAGAGNHKNFWLMLGGRGDNFSYPNPDGKEGHDQYAMGHSSHESWGTWYINGNNGNGTPAPNVWNMGQFNTDQYYAKVNAANPLGAPDDYYAARTGLTYGTEFERGSSVTPLDDDPDRESIYQYFGWDRIKMPGYFATDGETHHSAQYAACGTNAWAHIDLCDSSDEALSKKSVIAKPVSWASTRIEVILNAGDVDIGTEGVLQIRLGNGTLLPLSLI